MSDDAIDATSVPHLDRRNLLKKAGAAGAIAWTAPLVLDSFLSPAAAASVAFSMTQHDLFETNDNTESQSTGLLTVPLVADNLVLVTVAYASASTVTITSVTGSSISDVAEVASIEYEEEGNHKSTLSVWRATGVGGTAAITVAFSGQTTTNIISVSQASVPAVPNPVLANVLTAEDEDETAEVSFASVSPPSGEFFAVSANPTAAHDDHVWSTPAGWNELQDDFQDSNGNVNLRDVSLATFWRAAAATGQAQSAASGFNVGQSIVEWGAIRVEIDP